MGRDFWNTRRLVPRVHKIRQTITLPAASCKSFRRHASIYANGGDDCDMVSNNSASIGVTDNFTVEFAVLPYPKQPDTGQTLLSIGASGGADYLIFSLSNSQAGSNELLIVSSSLIGLNTLEASLTAHQWNFVALTYDDAGSGAMNLYVNGELVATRPTSGVAANAFDNFTFNSASSFDSVPCYFGELKVWDVTRDLYIPTEYDHVPGEITEVPNLIGYVPMNDGVGSAAVAQNGDWTVPLETNDSWSLTEFPPVKFGASFVVAEWAVALDQSVSLVWPRDPDDDTTGMLAVRWLDADGEVQRRRLWDYDGVDISPMPALYAGENLTTDFVFELWCVDGDTTCVLPNDFVISISYTTNPTTSYDRVQTSAATLTVDKTLAATYPLTFPITFDTQQTY